MLIDERHHPGLFYRYVVAQIPDVQLFYTSDADVVALRLRMVAAAGDLLAIDGIDSVAWPAIQLFDDGTRARVTPIGTLDVQADADVDLASLTDLTRTVATSASDSTLELRITVNSDDSVITIRPRDI
ncbi:hypothetical protein [Sanguibacter sp. 25GB23B1]|uniref:hypothetical protein n=1 Tax=unclassified Sanguibacter TaxID=2645534 RepID=UPI0032AF3F10